MTRTYKNLGPPWARSSTETVPHGGTFAATEREHERIQRRRRGATFQLLGEAPDAPTQAPAKDAAVAWPLKMAPDRYLQLHPDGPKAALARAVLGLPDPTGP